MANTRTEKKASRLTMLGFLCGSVLFAVLNSISYKTMLNKYKSQAPLRSAESSTSLPTALPSLDVGATDGASAEGSESDSEGMRRRRLESSEHNYEFFANQVSNRLCDLGC